MKPQKVTVTAPASVAFLKGLYEQVGPGLLDWDFSRPNQVSAPAATGLGARDGVLKSLTLENAGLVGELKIRGAVGLESLEFTGNSLTAVDFGDMPKLEYFKITDDHLLTLTLGGGLGTMDIGCEIEAKNMERLIVKGRNRLGELHIKASRLEYLTPFRRLKNLFVLRIKSDVLRDLSPLAGCCFPGDLSLKSPLLSDLHPLGQLRRQQELAITGGLVTDLSPLVALRSTLHVLDIASPVLSDLRPLAQLKNLSILGIISDAVCDLSPLAGLKKLCDLVLEGKAMQDFSPIAALEENLYWEIINGHQLKGGEGQDE
jgi:Leucine-rich repeat (LRR) protein